MYLHAYNLLTIWLIFTKNMINRVVRRYLCSIVSHFLSYDKAQDELVSRCK